MSHDSRNTSQDPPQPTETEIPHSSELGEDDLDAVTGGLGAFQPSIPKLSIGTGLPAGEIGTCITRL